MTLHDVPSESHALFAATTALFGLALEFSRNATSWIPIAIAGIGAIGTLLLGIASVIREYRELFVRERKQRH